MFRRQHAIVATLCLSTIALLSAGCDDSEPATPQVIFDGHLERGNNASCQDSTLFTIGEFGNQAAETADRLESKPVKDGEAFEQGTVTVSCAVTPAGADEFNVEASVALNGATGGFFRVDGKFKATGEQTGIHAIFSSRKTQNTYEQKDRACVVRYTSAYQGVAAGRVWGEITCPNAENPTAQTACEGIAQFRFENCGQ
jgi:hypothetical protein